MSAGTFVKKPILSVPLNLPEHSQLVWDGAFTLRTEVAIRSHGGVIGRVVAEAPLQKLTAMFQNVRGLGATAEIVLCAPAGTGMNCFPSSLNPTKPLIHLPMTLGGAPLPMSYALAGHAGLVVARDYRHQKVIAAYSPVGQFGLGVVLKIDSADLYAPVWRQLRQLVPIFTAAVLAAILLLRWQLMPLVIRLVESERKAREMSVQLQENENHVRAVIDHVNEGIISISEQGTIELFNPRAESMFGHDENEMLGRHISELLPEPQPAERDGYLKRHLFAGGDSSTGLTREFAARRKNGQNFTVEVRLSDFNLAGRHRIIAAMLDISERKAAEEKIIHLATHDALTDLPNRTLIQDRIDQAIRRARRSGSNFGVLFIDLDQFKTINDSLGHDIGDKLLQAVANRLIQCLRSEDTVSRQGGDEFIVLLPSLASPEDCAVVAGKILNTLTAPISISGHDLHTSASIGIAVYPKDGGDVETLLKNSDTAMYHAKEEGRGSYRFFAAESNAAAAERLMLGNSLHRATERNEMSMHYQPLVSIADGQVIATEALLRWNHPKLGFVSPVKFIPIAEDSGQILPLGEWVFREVCKQIANWRGQGFLLPRVAINISPRQFRQKHLAQTFAGIIKETAVDPTWISLEITESSMMGNPTTAISTLEEFKEMGIELSLDDFGTGYSSLSNLKRFPIDKLKIDRSFIRDLAKDSDDAAMVTAIIAMAHRLGIQVVAEGVETDAQLAFLRAYGCDEYQGYYFSKPMPAAELVGHLIAYKSTPPISSV